MSKRTLGAAVVLVVSLAACGGGNGGSPTPISTPVPAPTRTLVGQGNFSLTDTASALRQFGIPDVFLQTFTLGSAGTVDVTVDWTFRSNDLDLAIIRGSCSPSQLLASQCNTTSLAAQSLSTTAKPETLNVRLDPGTYTLAILSNVGNSQESGSFQVFVTR